MNDEDETLRRVLKLPPGCVVAQYICGLREVVQYDIYNDEYLVRHDWVNATGIGMVVGKPISSLHWQAQREGTASPLIDRRVIAIQAKRDCA